MDEGRVAAPLAAFLSRLKAATPARVGLARTGASLVTQDLLSLELAQAEARDSVHAALDIPGLVDGLAARGLQGVTLDTLARDRAAYLSRPDWGRRLDEASRSRLESCGERAGLAVVLADGLSARAINDHALPFLDAVLPLMVQSRWTTGPIALVRQGRVAVGDEIGVILGASLVVVCIGERPGLTSPNSLGVYLTWAPAPGRTDAERNCISNIRPEGVSFGKAAARTVFLCNRARELSLSGIGLKDESAAFGTPGSWITDATPPTNPVDPGDLASGRKTHHSGVAKPSSGRQGP